MSLSEDFEVKDGHKLTIPAGSELIVSEGIEREVNGNLIIGDGGILTVNGSLSGDSISLRATVMRHSLMT